MHATAELPVALVHGREDLFQDLVFGGFKGKGCPIYFVHGL